MHRSPIALCVCAILTSATAYRAEAAMPVVDVRAITQLVTQIRTLQDQLNTAKDHLTQARQEFSSITGGRGMERLLSGVDRNYLPTDWQQFADMVKQAGATYRALSTQVQTAIDGIAVLTPQDIANLSPAEREQLETARRSAATLQVTTGQALSAASNRFNSIQQLIDAIPRAADQKGILDLQARIQAEQGMLQNEQTKLDVLYQAAQAEEWARKQRAREQAIAGIGSLRRLPPMGL